MQKKYKISIATIIALMLAVLATNLVMGATSNANMLDSTAKSIQATDTVIISADQAEDKEQLRELAPETFEEAEVNIYPIRSRFLLYTNDGIHIMWGSYGNGRFVGTDNLGKRCWGIYGRGVFAGFYDGEFFYGKYSDGTWKAEYLFGLQNSQGKYVLFPHPILTDQTVDP